MITYKQYIKALEIVKQYHIQLKTVEEELNKLSPFATTNKEKPLREVVSARLCNVLLPHCPLFMRENNGAPISTLSKLSKTEFMKYRGAGKRVLKELEELCKWAGVKMLP